MSIVAQLATLCVLVSGCSGSVPGPDREAVSELPPVEPGHPASDPVLEEVPTTSTTPPVADDQPFFEDFSSNDSMSRFAFDLHHRDDHVVSQTQWPGDHAITGPDDACTGPDEKRVVHRGDRASDFNDEWIYRCAPGGDPAKAHLMTSIGDTSGYSIGAFTPNQTFNNVKEVRWDINLTQLGTRQFPEVKIIPADRFDFQDLPCALDWLPCDTATYPELGAVGTTFFNHEVTINNGIDDDRYWAQWGSDYCNLGDPALTSIAIRRQHVFRDNGDGTLTFGIEQPDGTFFEYSRPGSFPTGPVRVVFADHNYTPTKDNPSTITFTWHWDNIGISPTVTAGDAPAR